MTSRDGGRDFTGTCQILTFTYRPNLRWIFARNIFLRSLMRDGHQSNHPIGLKILGMIKLTINFSLVKKKSKYLCLKIWIFPISLLRALPLKKINIVFKWPRPLSPLNMVCIHFQCFVQKLYFSHQYITWWK